MMKEAVEGEVIECGLHNAIAISDPKWTDVLDKFNRGDKVKVIIVKDDEI